jgi:hypothetical protein
MLRSARGLEAAQEGEELVRRVEHEIGGVE